MRSVTSIFDALAAGKWTDEEREERAGLVVGGHGESVAVGNVQQNRPMMQDYDMVANYFMCVVTG